MRKYSEDLQVRRNKRSCGEYACKGGTEGQQTALSDIETSELGYSPAAQTGNDSVLCTQGAIAQKHTGTGRRSRGESAHGRKGKAVDQCDRSGL